MRAFWMSLAVLVAITAISVVGLQAVDMSAAEIYSSTHGNVRM